ncbi:YggS family pyridoxal phosphate-dependent enzyme [Ignatzschineria cameli]|uniref:Pyridoxal phosphate homeostasis protein n=1 Tax=Ignatzschineria cameli TaxID=2182793 RepID=A0A2U2AT63_9GAMM|nr:YggS family pyridoxal phosphate-dependent enzyme [Ignatzschineria cameli]PWD85975.1 YggS family pyridoxal phosphate-dependent enzyme [Ignatzschineria cameli]PWD87815.1 YggS family pyridoxal phosphate-dependent enzyme [Ignatzschineria cameli]PWD90384.1 YggS family pyridoxal phosphate-dependent enzyme [Ignatzschineria cameli]PWD92267.1 YggS family pyridoxal phosphate-dependent enzyme [Ignatzschineria cameli]PWD93061.1 YggS family pyridoxal phosphate-dependent enzyme [Ignatzschineria cameli]
MTLEDQINNSKLISNIEKVCQRIESAAKRAQRDPNEISLLLATKQQPIDIINNAIALGYGLIGENRAQELVEKVPHLLKRIDIPFKTVRETHFIGPLQGNKVNEVVAYADCIQSVDRIRIARRIDRAAQNFNKNMAILVQVNSSLDPNKQGLLPKQLAPFLEEIATFSHLQVRGLMTIGKQSNDPEVVRTGFAALRQLSEEMRDAGLLPPHAKTLSMGMSGDLELAIEEGATIIRIGSDIFGARKSF